MADAISDLIAGSSAHASSAHAGSTISLFPLPAQLGAPYFDSYNITDFIASLEELTLDWTDI